MLRYTENRELLLTHKLVPSGPIPTIHDSCGIYPYESYCETSASPVLNSYRTVLIENDIMSVKICPDLGGRVCSLFLKQRQTECLFFPHVVRPVRILPRQAFTGGGIEVSFPISHSPVELSPILHEVCCEAGRIYLSCGEREIRYGMRWAVEYSLGETDDFLTQRTIFFNPDRVDHPWMSWSSAAVPAAPDTQFHFPGGTVLVHDSALRSIDWRSQGPKQQSDIKRMTGFFWETADCNAFGVFTPGLHAGLYHVAGRGEVPGIKLWSDGVGRDEEWVAQYTLDGSQCLEMQAGPLIDQSIKSTLPPNGMHHRTEFWIPATEPRCIEQIRTPRPILRPIQAIPRFGWARTEEVSGWLTLLGAWEERDSSRIPDPPTIVSNSWAPGGMSELGAALSWVASACRIEDRDTWLFQFGTWLAARGEISSGLDVLGRSRDDRARALCGRLRLTQCHDAQRSVDCFREIESEAIALHPQVFIDRDKALATLGEETIEERKSWLRKVSALDDERLVECRARVLHDSGDPSAAMRLLKNGHFQRIHQRYERTRLWRQIELRLGLKQEQTLTWLGEDDLAEFGAYREFSDLT